MMKPYYLPLSFFVCHLLSYFFLPCVTAQMDDWNSTSTNNCSAASMFLITNSSAYMEASEQWILHMGELCTNPTITRCGEPPMCTFTNVTNATTIHWTLTLDFPLARILRNDEYMNRMNQKCVNAGGKVVYSDYYLQLLNFNYTTFAFHHQMEGTVDPTLVQVLDVFTTGMPDCVDPVSCTNRTTVGDFIMVEWATYNDAVVSNFTMTNMTWDTTTFAEEEDGLL